MKSSAENKKSVVKVTFPLRIYDKGVKRVIHECTVTIQKFTPSLTNIDIREALRTEFNYSPDDELKLGLDPIPTSRIGDLSLLMNNGVTLFVSESKQSSKQVCVHEPNVEVVIK